MSWVGSSVKRVEDDSLVRGKGRFVDDLHLPGMLEAMVVRSPFAHARIRGIDTAVAKAAPGVRAVFTLSDLPAPLREKRLPLLVPSPAIRHPRTQYVLAKDEVCHVGEPVAVVIAEDRYRAEDAAELVVVDYDPLPATADCRAAVEPGAATVHADLPDNLGATLTVAYGSVDEAFRDAPHVFRESLFQHRGGGHSMECRGVLAAQDPIGGVVTIWASTQAPHQQKEVFAEMMELPAHQVRVVAPDVGGGFGPKVQTYPEHVFIPAIAMALGRPVKWIEDRREHFIATHQERDQYWEAEIAVDEAGRIRGIRGSLIHDAGAYMPWGVVQAYISATTLPGPYVVPAYRLEATSALTNKVATTPVRGAGRPQAVFVMERLMDRVARELKLDPAEVRRRNFVQPEQMPYAVGLTFRDGSPVVYDSGDYPACQAKALELADYDGFRERQAEARRQGRYIGIGIGNCVEGTGLGPFEGCTVRVGTDGKVVIETGAAPQGQGHRTMLAQICADALGIDMADVTVVTADTDGVEFGIGTFGSRITVNAGSSVHVAAGKVREKALKIASHLLEAAAEDLDIADGRIFVKGVPDIGVPLTRVAAFAKGAPGFSMPDGITPGLEETNYFTPQRSTYANGTHVVEVEVDAETGMVRILRYSVAHDCGKVVNPMTVAGQVVGGVAHGVGNALYEWMRYDENAQPVTTNFGEYLLPLATEMPRVDQTHLESPTPLNPLGVKGAGEGGTIPVPAAVAAAVEDALSPFGVKITRTPITPPDLLALIDAARGGGEGD